MATKYAQQMLEVTRLRAQLIEAEEALYAAMISNHPIKAGDVVEDKHGNQYLISKLKVRDGDILVLGRKKTRSGWHPSPWELSWRDIKKLPKPDHSGEKPRHPEG
jgi:hypothetical protein